MYPSSCSYYQLAVVTAETMAAEGLKEVQEEEEHRALAERSKSTMPQGGELPKKTTVELVLGRQQVNSLHQQTTKTRGGGGVVAQYGRR